jgi:hypothetical protein
MRMGFRLILLSVLLACPTLNAQQITRIYVADVSQNPSLEAARKDLVSGLRKLKSVRVVSSANQANATLITDGEIYLTGYYSLNPRSGLSPAHGKPVYGGYLSVRVRSSSGDIVWSYFADTTHSTNAARDLSKKVVKHFAETFNPA